jgi:hypothetical protein
MVSAAGLLVPPSAAAQNPVGGDGSAHRQDALELGSDAGAVVTVGLGGHRAEDGAEQAAGRRSEDDLENVHVAGL